GRYPCPPTSEVPVRRRSRPVRASLLCWFVALRGLPIREGCSSPHVGRVFAGSRLRRCVGFRCSTAISREKAENDLEMFSKLAASGGVNRSFRACTGQLPRVNEHLRVLGREPFTERRCTGKTARATGQNCRNRKFPGSCSTASSGSRPTATFSRPACAGGRTRPRRRDF